MKAKNAQMIGLLPCNVTSIMFEKRFWTKAVPDIYFMCLLVDQICAETASLSKYHSLLFSGIK